MNILINLSNGGEKNIETAFSQMEKSGENFWRILSLYFLFPHFSLLKSYLFLFPFCSSLIPSP